LNELKEYPCLFVTEEEAAPSRVGVIKNITVDSASINIDYELTESIPPLKSGSIDFLSNDLDINPHELFRTHWAIKSGDLYKSLFKSGIISHQPQEQTQIKSNKDKDKHNIKINGNKQVFVVHGRDEFTKLEMADAIKNLGFDPIILHQQASAGMTIIEKINAYTNVHFAVVLYTPCDWGGIKGPELLFQSRARQNVVFEHGYLIAKLGRNRVVAFVKGKVEIPNDLSGVVYVPMDSGGEWKNDLEKEIKAVVIADK
jgi:predicted nucleotide-binding protein